MAAEGVVLKKTNFGPYPYADGEYGHMSWDRVRAVVRKLTDLGLIRASNGQYTWTRLGRSVLKRLSEDDAKVKA
jgi:hypothetical protein